LGKILQGSDFIAEKVTLISVRTSKPDSTSTKISLSEQKIHRGEKISDEKKAGKVKWDITASILDEITPRSIIFKPESPEYPAWAKSLGSEFEIELKFSILPDGTVGIIEKVISSGYPEIDEIGMRYIRKWKFMPLTKNALPQHQWGIIKLFFRAR